MEHDFRVVPVDKFGERLHVGDRVKFYGESGMVIAIMTPRALLVETHIGEILEDVLPEDLVKQPERTR